jgi:cytochrome c-type biogenesis protein CcmF
MAALGSFLLVLTFVFAAYAVASSIAGARRRNNRLVESGIGAFYTVAALLTVASGIIVYAFVSGDFSIRYVQRTSDSLQPLFYKLTSYWGGLDGSVMFWVFLMSIFGSIAVKVNRERHRELIPYVVAVTAITEMFFIFLMLVHNNPFDTFLTESPSEGRGLSPLLQNFYMAIHPPTMYLGFTGLTIPFAFGLAALITGQLDDSWLRAVRRWTMFAWFFLSLGLTLGMIWAYEELGWGGFWMWDPVENAGALPWFTATAFLHSVMVQERRGMLRAWNVTLVIITFLLTMFQTYMTRSGIVQSVHAFGEDPELGRMFIAFIVTVSVVSFGLVIYRLPMLRARNELESWASREGAFLANNWILLFSAFFILFATMFPTISEAVSGERITVGPPFFNLWMTPIGLMLLLLTGIGPLLAWRRTSLRNLVQQFIWPTASALAIGGVVVALGVRIWSSGICFALCGFVFGTITQEYLRGASVRKAATGSDLFTALVGLVGRNKRRYGGYVVHLGIVLMFLGFAGEGLSIDEQLLLKPGEEAVVHDYTIHMDALRATDDGQKQMITGHFTIKGADGSEITRLFPAKWIFRKHEDQPTTEVAIRRSFAEDIYLVMAGFELADQTASLEFHINPLVNWIWIGFGILALGTLIALLPESTFSFATASAPAGAVTTSIVLLALLMSPAAGLAEQEKPHGVVPRGELQRRLEERILCLCGGCRSPMGSCPMRPNCRHYDEQSVQVATYIREGRTYDEVLTAYIREHQTQAVLAAPIDRGFNRLAWAVPYAIGIAGLVIAGVFAVRWSRRPAAAAPAAVDTRSAADQTLQSRLDDELRDLD